MQHFGNGMGGAGGGGHMDVQSGSMDDEAFYNALDMDGGDEHALDGGKKAECTGRWTREEHILFIKGLELYGKGWKKIAGLIKTRTVVQIRTHAQKYFLKLSKARQNGEPGGNLSMDGKSLGFGGRKKSRKKNLSNANIALAEPLIPFVKATGENEAIDIDDGLYNFLSPVLPSSRMTANSDEAAYSDTKMKVENAHETGSGSSTDPSQRGSKLHGRGGIANRESALGAEVGNVPPHQSHLLTVAALSEKPQWFQKGLNVDSLLRDAENLDWMQDSGSSCLDEDGNQKFAPMPAHTSVLSAGTSNESSSSSTSGDSSDSMGVRRGFDRGIPQSKDLRQPGMHGNDSAQSFRQKHNGSGAYMAANQEQSSGAPQGRSNAGHRNQGGGVDPKASDIPVRAPMSKKPGGRTVKGKPSNLMTSAKGAQAKSSGTSGGRGGAGKSAAKSDSDTRSTKKSDSGALGRTVGARGDTKKPAQAAKHAAAMAATEKRDPLHDAIDEHMRTFVMSGIGNMGNMSMPGMPTMPSMGDFDDHYNTYDRNDHEMMLEDMMDTPESHVTQGAGSGSGSRGTLPQRRSSRRLGGSRNTSEQDMKIMDGDTEMRSNIFFYGDMSNGSPLRMQAFSTDGGDDMGIGLCLDSGSNASADDADIDMFGTPMSSAREAP